jgi:hypothetical protein
MRTSNVPVTEILAQCQGLGVTLALGEHGTLRVSPPGRLPSQIKEELKAHKEDILKLVVAPPADVLSDDSCEICGSRERWQWLDGRLLCRVCVVLDLRPMSLLPSGNGVSHPVDTQYSEGKACP